MIKIAVIGVGNIAEYHIGGYIKNPDVDLLDIIKAPDFTTGGYLLYDRAQMEEIHKTGCGSFK